MDGVRRSVEEASRKKLAVFALGTLLLAFIAPVLASFAWRWGLWLFPVAFSLWALSALGVVSVRAPHWFLLTAGASFLAAGFGLVAGPILVDSEVQPRGRDSRCIYDIPATPEGVPLPLEQWDFPTRIQKDGLVSVPWVLDCYDSQKTPLFVRLLEPIGTGLIAAGLVQLVVAADPSQRD